jgi:hypothetical protein
VNPAAICCPELARRRRGIPARAELEAHDRALQRTERLVEIGAASRQELERIHAEHTAQTANVQSARTKLELLGVSDAALEALAPGKDVDATTSVPAPIDGIVTERVANPGLNVDPSMKLFTVVDLSTVWVLADLYERDFVNVQVGSQVTVTTSAYPALSLRGRVSYIDPQVNLETRTARLRVEVQNTRGEPARHVCGRWWAPSERAGRHRAARSDSERAPHGGLSGELAAPGRFVERDVAVGAWRVRTLRSNRLQLGDVVVTGAAFVRAERTPRVAKRRNPGRPHPGTGPGRGRWRRRVRCRPVGA